MKLKRKILIGFITALILIVVSGYLSYKSAVDTISDNIARRDINNFIKKIFELSSDYYQCESLESYYIITHNDEYLTELTIFNNKLKTDISTLNKNKSSVIKGADLEILYNNFNEILDNEIKEDSEKLEVFYQKDSVLAKDIYNKSENNKSRIRINNSIDRMINRLEELRSEINDKAGVEANLTKIAITAGSALALLMLLFAFVMIKKDIVGKEKAEQKLKEINENLEHLVNERTNTLKESEEKYRSLFENMSEGYEYCQMLYKDDKPIDWIIVSANKSFEKLMGLSNVGGKRVSELIPGIHESDPKLLEINSRVALTGKPEKFEIFVEAQNAWFSVSLLCPQKGYFVNIFEIITERKQIENALRESESRYRSLFENMSEGYAFCNMLFENGEAVDWKYIVVNKSFETLTGLNDVDGKLVSEVIPNIRKVDPKLFEIYSRVSLTGIPEKFEMYVESLKLWFSISVYSPEKNYFVAVFDVINDRKLAEEQIKQSEKRLRSFYESGLVGVVYWNKDGSISHANDKYLNMLGYTRQELNEGKVNWIASTPAEFKHIDDECIAELMEFGVNKKRYEKEYARKDGSRVPVMLAGAMLDDERLKGVAYVLDITERKQAENLLKESENKFLSAFKNSPFAMAITSVDDKKYIDVNEVFIEDCGFAREEIIGHTSEELRFFVDDRDRGDLLSEVKENGSIYCKEVKIRTKSGKILNCLISISLIKISGKHHLLSSIVDITDRIQAEEKIIVSETRYRRLFESAKDGILILDAGTGMIVDVNPFLIEILGYPREAFLKKTIWDIGFFKDITSNEEKFWELQQNEYIRYEDVPLETFDGRKINVEFVSNVYMVDHTKVIQCNIRDITERKLIEKSLIESEAKLSNAMKFAHLGHWEFDVGTGLFTFNDHFYALFRTTVEKEGGYTMTPPEYAKRFVHPDDREMVAIEVKKSLESIGPEYSTQLEHRIIYADGEIGYISVRLYSVKDANGRVIKNIGVNQDITERRKAEELLHEQNVLLQTLINNSPDLIYIKDEQSRFKMASNSVAEYMGTTPVNIIGKSDADFYPEELAEKYNSDEKEIIESGKALINSEEPRINNDGHKNWILTTKVPLYNTVGKISGILGISRDITQLKIDELRIQHLNMVYSVLSNVNEAIVRIAQKKKLLDEICRVMVEEGKTALVWVGFVDNITKKIIPYSKYGYDKGYLDKIDISVMDIPSGRGPIGACIREDRYLFINDVKNDPRMEPWKDAALERGYNSVCAFPLKIKGKAIGAIAIYAYETNFFNEDEIKLMVELAGDVSFALETIELNESRKIAEQKILEDELILEALVNNIPESVLLTDKEGKIIFANETVAHRFKKTQDELIGKNAFDQVDKDVAKKRKEYNLKAVETRKQVKYQDKRFGRFIDNYITPVIGKEGEVTHVTVLGVDRTENILTEEEIRKSEQLLRFHVENTPLGVVEWDLDFCVRRWNHSAEKIFGYTKDEAIGKHSSFIVVPESNEIVKDSWEGLLSNRGGFRFTNSNQNKDGDIIICSWYNTPLLDKDGKVMRVVSLIDDITEKVEAENKLKISLDERELLLKEIHHRVKNNLQVVSSLLKIQSEHVKDEVSKEYFKISADRVKAMALIHQQLYGSTNLSSVNFDYYLRNLASHLYNLYCQKPEAIKMTLNSRGVTMNIDNAVPCGLLVNEVLTNSLKHGFPGNKKGEIFVNLKLIGDEYILEMGDTGIGISEDVDFKEEKTLGVQLIQLLVEQLDATMEIDTTKGTLYKIKFSAFTYKKRV